MKLTVDNVNRYFQKWRVERNSSTPNKRYNVFHKETGAYRHFSTLAEIVGILKDIQNNRTPMGYCGFVEPLKQIKKQIVNVNSYDVKRIKNVEELKKLAIELDMRPDWHEPDEQGVTVRVMGDSFDNAGHWGTDFLTSKLMTHQSIEGIERFVVICKDGKPIAEVNLATLFAMACQTL